MQEQIEPMPPKKNKSLSLSLSGSLSAEVMIWCIKCIVESCERMQSKPSKKDPHYAVL